MNEPTDKKMGVTASDTQMLCLPASVAYSQFFPRPFFRLKKVEEAQLLKTEVDCKARTRSLVLT